MIKNKTITALVNQPLEEVKEASLDETSYKKGHNYFTVLADTKRKKVVGISIGKGQESVNEALIDMEVRGGSMFNHRFIAFKVQNFVNMIHTHWYGIKTYFKKLKTNAERINLKIQEIKRIARGFSNTNNFIIVIYFHLGGLDLGLPTKNG